METEKRLQGKKVLIVDDEPDILDALCDLLSMCDLERASSFEEARALLESRFFEIAVLDIMGVQGYDLLEICTRKNVMAVMLTARALTPGDVKKSFDEGAAFYVPKEEMVHIATFLADILEARAKGQSTWGRWYERFAVFCERKFGPGWQKSDQKFWDKFPFY